MNDMRAILDESFEDEVSGEAILSGSREVRVYVPDEWTPEYVFFRMKEAFETLRRARVGRIGPKGGEGYWPEIFHDLDDMRGWAEDHKVEAERAKERARTQPSGADLARMDEALAWPMRFLSDRPLESDAVLTAAYADAWEIDPGVLLKYRKAGALPVAERIAARMNAELRLKAAIEKASTEQWAVLEFKRLRVPAMTSTEKRVAAVDKINAAGEKRMKRWRKMNPTIKANATLALPNRIVDVGALKTMRPRGLALLAERLTMAGVPVR